MNLFATLLGPHRVAGFQRRQSGRDRAFFPDYADDRAEPRRWLTLLDHIGVATAGEAIGWQVREADRRALEALSLPPGRLAVLHPGASDPARRWPAERFATVGDWLSSRGLQIVVSGTDDEAPIARDVLGRMRRPAIDLAGHTTLGTAAALVERATLVVTNDTGMSHLAAAVGTRSVVLFIASDRERWRPLDADRHRAVGDGCPDESKLAEAAAPPTCDEVLAAIDELGVLDA